MNPAGVVVAWIADEVGGSCAISYVPATHLGHCEVRAGEQILAVVGSPALARRVAAYAIGPNGGYSDVSIAPSSQPLTCCSFEHWAAISA